MLQKNIIFTLAIFPLFLGTVFLSVPNVALAKTLYVAEDGDDSNDGSADHPYETLKKAADEVNEGEADEVKVGKGSFSGGVTFDQGVSLEGKGKGSTTITGSLTFKKKAALREVSIKTKEHNAITLAKGAVGDFEDIDVRDFIGVGIWITSGNGGLTLKDSRIGGSGGKGIYAESGTKLTVIGSSIVNNKQEGIDIRQNTRGTIKNNVIENNSESGIELIVGSSDFVISNNRIKNNGASGIAYQFYELNKKFGTIKAGGNTISGHRKYGIDCNKPQGGESPAGYWADSITLEENSFASNKMADVSTKCKILDAQTEEEEAKLEEQLLEEQKKEEVVAATPPLLESVAQEEVNQENQRVEELVNAVEKVVDEARYQELRMQIERRSKEEMWWHGWQGAGLEALRREVESDTNEMLGYQDELAELENYQARKDLQKRVREHEEKLAQYQGVLAGYDQEKGAQEYVSFNIILKINKFLYAFLF